MLPTQGSKNIDIAKQIRDKFDKELAEGVLGGLGYTDICASIISDAAAKGVAAEFEQDEEVCEMHQGDKIGRSAVGTLVRSKNKVQINPFKEGKMLLAKVHNLGVHFQYGDRFPRMIELYGNVEGPDKRKLVPNCTIKMDYNKTRVNSSHGLILSVLRLHRPLKCYIDVGLKTNEEKNWHWRRMIGKL